MGSWAYVVVAVFWEEDVELFQELHHLVRSVFQLVDIAVSVDVAEASSYWLIDKEQVRELGPGPVVVGQISVWLDSVRPNLHHGAIHRTTSRTSVQP